MNTRGLPGMLAPRYHESARMKSVGAATALTCSTHSASAPGSASMVHCPCARVAEMVPAIHSTCCSIETGMLLRTEGLPGPVIMNMFGNPAVEIPRYVLGPAAHL